MENGAKVVAMSDSNGCIYDSNGIDLDLIKQAYKSNIIIVGTASLLTTIRLVNQLLAQQKQAESVQQIVTAGANLYDTFVQFCDDLVDLQKDLNNSPHKEIKNILTKYLPQKVVNYILKGINETTKAHQINGSTRDLILDRIHDFKINIVSTNKGEETVTAGGIDLDEVNSKTMELKRFPNLYAIGEVLNIDGFCGGFNLQNAWSTAYVCAEGIDLSN